jgi:hypothetical protein
MCLVHSNYFKHQEMKTIDRLLKARQASWISEQHYLKLSTKGLFFIFECDMLVWHMKHNFINHIPVWLFWTHNLGKPLLAWAS